MNNIEDYNLLLRICYENNVDIKLVTELLEVEKELQNQDRRYRVFDRLREPILNNLERESDNDLQKTENL